MIAAGFLSNLTCSRLDRETGKCSREKSSGVVGGNPMSKKKEGGWGKEEKWTKIIRRYLFLQYDRSNAWWASKAAKLQSKCTQTKSQPPFAVLSSSTIAAVVSSTSGGTSCCKAVRTTPEGSDDEEEYLVCCAAGVASSILLAHNHALGLHLPRQSDSNRVAIRAGRRGVRATL